MSDLAERFWEKVDKQGPVIYDDIGPCWLWKAATNNKGYGWIRYAGRMHNAHRISWLLSHGELPSLHVLHKCDNPTCVNPKHLFLGTNADNVADKVSKGRAKLFARKGEQQHNAKLTNKKVIQIRSLYSRGKTTQADLANQFRVQQTNISRIVRGIGWAHV